MQKINFGVMEKKSKRATDKVKDKYILIVTRDRKNVEFAEFQRNVFTAAADVLGTDSETETLTGALATTVRVAELLGVKGDVGYKGVVDALDASLAGGKVKTANPDKKQNLVTA